MLFGAALGACGGNVDSGQATTQAGGTGAAPPQRPDGGAAGGSTAVSTGGAGGASPMTTGGAGGTPTASEDTPQTPRDCRRTAQFLCDRPDGTCRCDTSAPTGPASCAEPYEFVCDEVDPVLVGCRCDAERLDPAACPDPTQWRCAGPRGLDCTCDATAPAEPSDCLFTEHFQCQLWEPVFWLRAPIRPSGETVHRAVVTCAYTSTVVAGSSSLSSWLGIARAVLRRDHSPVAHAFLQKVGSSSDLRVAALRLLVFLTALEEMGRGVYPFGPEGPPVRATLARHGLTEEREAEGRALLERAKTGAGRASRTRRIRRRSVRRRWSCGTGT